MVIGTGTRAGVTRTASISPCGTFRWTLGRSWDAGLPTLLVAMFGPSDADATIDDPTITLTCHIAAHNGYGGIVVVNGIPLRSSKTAPQYAMLDWNKTSNWGDRDRLQDNLAVVAREAARASAALLAWGALAGKTWASAYWFANVREEIQSALAPGAPLFCLGRTAAGHPMHPLARGKHKLPKTAPLLPWSTEAPCAP